MKDLDQQLKETVAFIRKKTDLKPSLGFVLGSGLSAFGQEVRLEAEFSFKELPHFARASVEGHPGRLLLGEVAGVPVAVMQGRVHAYEGFSLPQVVYPIRLLAELGVQTLLVSNAAGGLRKTMKPGDFMVIEDHINLTGENPLRGANWARGARFVDMTEAYDPRLTKLLVDCLKKSKVRTHRGVYVGVMGPSYETAAEILFFGRIGGGTVGMSTVAEVIAARHAGLKVVGLSCVTNLGTGLSKTKLSHAEVKEVAGQAEKKFTAGLKLFTEKLASRR